MLGLAPLLDRKPKQLSGGQRQRVAMGRAMVREPKVFLFDEPLSNLDAGLRGQMRIEIGGLQRRLNTTTIYVTHDQVEAMTLGDRIVVLADGRIQQIGRPIDLYRAPVNRFVAGFIGTPPMNFVDGRLREENGQLFFSVGGIAIGLPRDKAARAKGAESLTLGIRPEDLHVNSSGSASETLPPISAAFDGRVVLVERLGATSHVHFDVEGSRMMASLVNDQLPEVGETISVRVSPERVHLFGLDGTTLSHSI
jgi:ABC-type sugar transport system ATPase subunit